jgi:chitodextrinase
MCARLSPLLSLGCMLLGGCLLIGGCPQPQQPSGRDIVSAAIGVSRTEGEAPLEVVFSGANSSSRNAGPLTYAWDFADDSPAGAGAQVTHTFRQPGLFRVTLRVTDAAGAVGTQVADIRVRGSAAVAVISADPTEGPAPLEVQFDATQSIVTDDRIRDYRWDFGDATTSTEAAPRHVYFGRGQYTVELRVTTAGGVAARTTTTINVAAPAPASLQFDGRGYALLPLGSLQNLSSFAFEVWVKAAPEGGTVASLTGGFSLDVLPTTGVIRLRIGGLQTDFQASGLTEQWRHIAVVGGGPSGDSGGAGGATTLVTVYLDGQPLGSTNATAGLSGAQVALGVGLRGKASEVRLWSRFRTQADINATRARRATGQETGLLAAWPLNEGVGDVLNNVVGSPDGHRGAGVGVDASDAPWSTDSPPLN